MTWMTLAADTQRGLDQASRLTAMRRGLDNPTSDPTEMIGWLFLVVAVLGVAAIVHQILRRRRNPGSSSKQSPSDYLRQAAQVLNLNRNESRDLRQVAETAGLSQPASMLLAPACLANAVELAAQNRDDPALRKRMNTLCKKLFDTNLPKPEPAEDTPDAT